MTHQPGPRPAGRWKIGLTGAALCVVVTLLSRLDPAGPWLDGLGHDLLLRLRGDRPMQGVTIVAMDEESYRELRQTPGQAWDRRLHADLIERALDLGARAVVFDIWFADPAPDPAEDTRLIAAIRNARGRVVLAGKLARNIQGGTNLPVAISKPFPPCPALAAIAPWGLVDLPADPDGRVRRHDAGLTQAGLAWTAAELLGVTPTNPPARRWINFRGPLPRQSYHRILAATNLPAGFFSNQVIFVGQYPVSTPSGPDFADTIPTSASRWRGQGTPGVETQAAIFLDLQQRDWIVRMQPGAETWALLGCAALIGFGFAQLRPWIAVWLAPPAAVLAAALAALALARIHLSLPWLTVAALHIPGALLGSITTHTRRLARDKAALEQRLATATLPPDQPQSHSLHPPKVPDCTLLRRVGQGGYGDVWLARDLVGNLRAVKTVYRARFPRAAPFERELRGLEKFSPISRTHPGWVDILHVGRLEGEDGFYYIMEAGDDQTHGRAIAPDSYAPRTLASDLQRHRKLPLPECIPIAIRLAEALAHLHHHGLVHRDIKPANVIFVNAQPRFADIGLVTEVSRPGHDVSMLGTEGYLAPEGPGAPAADVFSLGKLIYEMATGRDRRAFPELPTALESGQEHPAMEELYRILLKCCEYEPAHRYAGAAELRADLECLLARLGAANGGR